MYTQSYANCLLFKIYLVPRRHCQCQARPFYQVCRRVPKVKGVESKTPTPSSYRHRYIKSCMTVEHVYMHVHINVWFLHLHWYCNITYEVTRIIDLLGNFAISIYGFVFFCKSLFITISFRWEQHYSLSAHTVYKPLIRTCVALLLNTDYRLKKTSIIPTLPNHLMSSWWKP